jgi:capsular exopolysaccharide synthesis family protein
MEFWTYYRLLRKHYRTVVLAALVALIVGTIFAWPRHREYAATATLTTSPPDASRYTLILVSDRAESGPRPDTARVIQLIQSRTVAERVIQRLNLRKTPQQLRSMTTVAGGRDPAPLITIAVRDTDGAEAVRLVNTYAEVSVAYNQEVNRREATLARQYIEEQLQDTRARLTQAESALDAFKQSRGIVSMSSQIGAEVNRFLDLVNQQRASELSIRELSARIADLRVRLNQFSPTKTDKQFTVNPIEQKLRNDLVNLEIQLAIAQAAYTPEHPAVITLQQKIKALKEAMAGEIQKVLASEFVQVNPLYEGMVRQLTELETSRVAAQAKLQALGSIVPGEQKKLPALNGLEREYTRLSRAVQVLDTAYTGLETRLNEFRVREQAAVDRNPVYIVDMATSAQPTSPSKTMVRIAVAGMLGLVGGIGLVVFRTQIDNSMKTAKDAERLLGVPVLASIPKHNPPFDEAYRLLKTSLGLHATNGQTKAIMFTSPRPGSGTSTIVYHLARAIARGGKRVIVLDADVRHPSAHRLFGVTADSGVIEVLTGTIPLQEALRPTEMENIQILGAGRSPFQELADLFGTSAMTQLLDQLRQQTDVILIDTPPAVSFAESRVLAPLVDGVVLVVAAGNATRGVELDTKRELERAHARLLGVVINKVALEDDDSYYIHQKYASVGAGGTPGAGKRITVSKGTIEIMLLVLTVGAGVIAGLAFATLKVAPMLYGLVFHGAQAASSSLGHAMQAAVGGLSAALSALGSGLHGVLSALVRRS